jgi:serine/threonine protein kinase
MAALEHPNIAEVYDVGMQDDRVVVATECVAGGRSLETILDQGRAPPPMVILRMLAPLSNALHSAHSEGLVHRSVKPENMLVRKNGQAVLGGFELAVPEGTHDPLLGKGTVYGTPQYMAPECFEDTRAYRAADIWAMGISLHLLLTGRPPWELKAKTPVAVVAEILSRDAVDLTGLDEVVPPYVREVVGNCLAKDPAGRYPSAKALAQALDSAAERMESAPTVLPEVAPGAGETVLLEVEHREVSRQGQFRQYQIGELLGSGAFGDVFRAVDLGTGEEVALKILKSEWRDKAKAVARFRREAEVLARLEHSNIVRVHNFGRYGRKRFMAMELLPDRTLADAFEEEAPMAPTRAAALLSPLLDGLAEVHDRGIIHRDMKPSNIGLSGDRLVLFDFGIAAWEEAESLTASGELLGTPSYMSPEQARSERLTAASDVYSLGAILYQAVTGHLPHEGTREFYARLIEIAREPPVPITHWEPDLPRTLVSCVEGMMQRDPEARLTAREAGRMLTGLT